MYLRLYDGTDSIELYGGADGVWQKRGAGYVPRAPNISSTEIQSLLRDGGSTVNVRQLDVDESFGVYFNPIGSDLADAQTALHTVETLLLRANHYSKTGRGSQVYVDYRPTSAGSDTYRSPIQSGRLVLDKDALKIHPSGLTEGLIIWRRAYYWEGAAVALNMTNPSHVTPAAAVYVQNTTDSTYENYADIDGADVEGVLPAPIILTMLNNYNVVARDDIAHIGCNVFSSPASLSHILEGEDADFVYASTAPSASATSSNGYFQGVSWSGDAALRILEWELSSAQLGYMAGNWFRILGRVVYATPGLRVRPKLLIASLTTLWEGPEVDVNSVGVQDFGKIQLPPILQNQTSIYPLDLALFGREDGGGTLSLDFLQLTPLDGYRNLESYAFGVSYAASITDDGITNSLYSTWPTNKLPNLVGTGQRPMLWPGQDARLYFLFSNDTGGVEIDREHYVTVSYRPRRLTI